VQIITKNKKKQFEKIFYYYWGTIYKILIRYGQF